jgi:mannosyltransferase
MLRVLASRPDVGAIILGRATGRHIAFLKDITLKITNSGLGDRLLILPEVRTFEIPDWYRALDLFVAPQRWEGFGVTPLEAMASGVPVVATTVGAFTELVSPETGMLVPPKDVDALASAIADMLDHPERLTAMGSAARERAVKHYSIDIEAERIIQVYRDVLSGKRLQSESQR